MKKRLMEESDMREKTGRQKRGKVCVCGCMCVKRLCSALWSPKVGSVAAHGERLDCMLPP